MKTIKHGLSIILLAFLFLACSTKKMDEAEESVQTYISYVDSITNIDLYKTYLNLEEIEKTYNGLKAKALADIGELKDDGEALETDMQESTFLFQDFIARLEAKQRETLRIEKDNFKKALLGKNYIVDDMKMKWVNKNNVLTVYENFVNTVDENQKKYSAHEWDEVILYFEAIDLRKQTVEKEGLTNTDNKNIVILQLKFSEMYKSSRIGI